MYNDLRRIDLNLFVVLDALLEERSVAGAARKLSITPSAVSHCLRRLRGTLNDDLLTRTSRGLIPTSRALHLAGPIRDAMQEIRAALTQEVAFDPAASTRCFRVQFSNHFLGDILPHVYERMRTQAPGTTLEVVPLFSDSVADTSEILIRVNLSGRADSRAPCERVYEDRLVLVMRRDHPAAAQPMTPALFSDLAQLGPALPSAGTSALDGLLARHGLKRRIVARVAISQLIMPIVRRTDLCALLPARWVAAAQSDGESAAEFAAVDLPIADSRFTVDQVWHARSAQDAGISWLRAVIAQSFAHFAAVPLAASGAGRRRTQRRTRRRTRAGTGAA